MSNTSPSLKRNIEILDAVRGGYVFVRDNFDFLLKAAIIPILVSCINYITIAILDEDTSVFQSFLMTLPSSFVFAWYAFIQIRLHVYGETFGKRYGKNRQSLMVSSMSLYLLFQMFLVCVSFALVTVVSPSPETQDLSTGQVIMILSTLIFMLWAMKFSILHIIAAVGANLKDYVKRVQGLWFSYTLLGVGILSVLPIGMIFMFILSILMPNPAHIEQSSLIGLYACLSVMNWAIITMLNASAVETLKQLYQK